MKFAPFFIACTLGIFATFPARADETPAPLIDKTDAIIKEYQAEGLESLGTIRSDKQPVAMKFFVTTGDERKNMTASVFHRSRVLEIDVRRWHKAWRRGNFAIYETTPVHELTHVLQWSSDQNETRYQRELSANLVEVAYLHHRVGSTDPISPLICCSAARRPRANNCAIPTPINPWPSALWPIN